MEQKYNPSRLFLASCIALLVTSMTFAIRARLLLIFQTDFQLTTEEMGFAYAPAFYGFTLAMIFGGPLVDILGMKRLAWIAFISHAVGIVLTITATGFWSLFIGVLVTGIGNGMVEAVCNPLVASLYPKEKIKMLNRFHVWFPGGLMIGGIVSYFMIDIGGQDWQKLIAVLAIPLVTYGFLFLGQDLPKTERVSLGISTGDMWKAVATPLFLFMAFCMLLTAATELGTNQLIDSLLQSTGVPAILVLAFINGLMALGRSFAGSVVHKLSSSGMLLFSAIFSVLGLLAMSYSSGMMTFAAAGVFAIGICYFWPTMLGFVSEKIPASGALGLSIMGGLGMFSVSIVLPIMGRFMDSATSGAETLRYIAILPAILVVAFIFLFSKYRK